MHLKFPYTGTIQNFRWGLLYSYTLSVQDRWVYLFSRRGIWFLLHNNAGHITKMVFKMKRTIVYFYFTCQEHLFFEIKFSFSFSVHNMSAGLSLKTSSSSLSSPSSTTCNCQTSAVILWMFLFCFCCCSWCCCYFFFLIYFKNKPYAELFFFIL